MKGANMPGYVIHLAIAKKQIELNNIKNKKEYIEGVIAPDILKQQGIDSHYGFSSANPDIERFIESHSQKNDYDKGYLLHLITDFWF